MDKNIRISEETRKRLNNVKEENMLASHDAVIRFLFKKLEQQEKVSINS
jgi:hypothetical protein